MKNLVYSLVILFFYSCNNLNDKVEGSWVDKNKPGEIYRFHKDETIQIQFDYSGTSHMQTGNYNISNDSIILNMDECTIKKYPHTYRTSFVFKGKFSSDKDDQLIFEGIKKEEYSNPEEIIIELIRN